MTTELYDATTTSTSFLGSTEATSRWIDMFETLCARYVCRSVEHLAEAIDGIDGKNVQFVGGPNGKWLAEITSISLKRSADNSGGAIIAKSSKSAIEKLVTRYDRREQLPFNNCATGDVDSGTNGYQLVLDWFVRTQLCRDGNNGSSGVRMALLRDVERTTVTKYNAGGEIISRQCLLRVDRNNRLIVILVLDNTTTKQQLSPISVTCNSHVADCLRPFLFILACEFTVRGIEYENLSLHHETIDSGDCWLTKARQLHKRTKWVRVVKYNDVDSIMRDRIVCRRFAAGNLRMVWRDGCVLRNHRDATDPFVPNMHLLPVRTVLDLSNLQREIDRDERVVMSLCDFDVLYKRCEHVFASTFMYNKWNRAVTVQDEHRIATNSTKRYESRYFVNADNELISRPYIQLS